MKIKIQQSYPVIEFLLSGVRFSLTQCSVSGVCFPYHPTLLLTQEPFLKDIPLFKKGLDPMNQVVEARLDNSILFGFKLQKRISGAQGAWQLREVVWHHGQTPVPAFWEGTMGTKKDTPAEDFAGPRSTKGSSMQPVRQAVGQEQEQQKQWGMAQTCMMHGDKKRGALLLGMRSLRAWLCPCLPRVCGRRRWCTCSPRLR